MNQEKTPKRVKVDNEKYPDIHHWAKPAPEEKSGTNTPIHTKRKLAYIILALAALTFLAWALDITNAPAIPMDTGH